MIKKILIVLSSVLVLLFLLVNIANQLFSKLFEDPIIASLPKYEDSDCYYGEGFQDFTDYCKYYFPKNDDILEALKVNKYLKPVTDEDVEEIKGYFENFKGWVEFQEYKDKYDFRYESVDTSDYFYIENEDTCETYENCPDKYDNYDVYFFDVETKILYFIHSNI